MDAKYMLGAFDAVALLEEAAGDGPQIKTRIKLAPWGRFELRDRASRERWGMPGVFEIGEESQRRIAESWAGRDIDYIVNERHDQGGRALGWITNAEVVPGMGLFADVEWTADGRALIESRTYRYASGEYLIDTSRWEAGETDYAIPVALTGLGLTNSPAVKHFEPLAAQTIDDAITAARGGLTDGQRRPPKFGAGKESRMDGTFMTRLWSRITGAEPKDEAEAALAAVDIEARLKRVDELAKLVETQTAQLEALAAERDTAQQELAAIVSTSTEAQHEAAVAAALAAGKLSPAMVPWATGLSPEALTAYCEVTPNWTFSPPAGTQVGDDAVTAADSDGDTRKDLAARTAAYAQEHKISFADAYAIVGRDRR